MQRALLLTHLRASLGEKIVAAEADFASTLHARNSDTKSSAGDKHEVGRAMVQQELDQQGALLAKLRASQQELARVPVDRNFEHVAFGALVRTDQGLFFIAIAWGIVQVAGATWAVVSLASPIGQALAGKRTGDAVTLNGKTFTIEAIQ